MPVSYDMAGEQLTLKHTLQPLESRGEIAATSAVEESNTILQRQLFIYGTVWGVYVARQY